MKLMLHNDTTGENATPHKLGQDEDGNAVYQGVAGYELKSVSDNYGTDNDGCGDGFDNVDHYLDSDGNYVVVKQ